VQTPVAVTQPEVLWRSATKSGGLTVVISQNATESLAALDLTGCGADCVACLNHPVVEPLMISLRMKMGEELTNGLSQRSFPEEDDSV
jgi:hypothetical protein